jgi:aminobenzoyl-glutamate utilization protein B
MNAKPMLSAFALLLLTGPGLGQKNTKPPLESLKRESMQMLDSRVAGYRDIALRIWDFAELGYQEVRSSELLAGELEKEGFRVDRGVAGIPTAFVATYGSGSPVIAVLAEYDALPGLSQQAVPEKKAVEGRSSGHGCGHHLFGTASVAAGVEIKRQMQKNGWKGTVKVFGCPAEEGGSGKVYMVREGLFDDVDVAIHWHPDNENRVSLDGALANKSAKFRFHGTASHAAAAPEQGRSALDAVEAMNHMVNLMREHMPGTARVHYVITNGGKAPNVVPDFAEVYYYSRHPDKTEVVKLFDRIVKAAEGAALGTGTRMEYEIIGGTHDLLLLKGLNEDMHRNLVTAGGVSYSGSEAGFAKKIQSTLSGKAPGLEDASRTQPLTLPENYSPGSTDVGDVSYRVPTVGFRTATWVPGTPAHSWQAVACGGTEIGVKGMMVAAKAIAGMGIDLLNRPDMVANAKAEFKQALGDYRYQPLLGDRKPALDYRK